MTSISYLVDIMVKWWNNLFEKLIRRFVKFYCTSENDNVIIEHVLNIVLSWQLRLSVWSSDSLSEAIYWSKRRFMDLQFAAGIRATCNSRRAHFLPGEVRAKNGR